MLSTGDEKFNYLFMILKELGSIFILSIMC